MTKKKQNKDTRQGPVPQNNKGQGFLHSLGKILSSPDLKKLLPFIVLTSLAANILALALPLTMLQIFDRVLKSQSMETLAFLTIGVVLVLILEELLKSVNSSVTNWLGARYRHRTSLSIMERFFVTPMRLFSKDEPGAYAEKMQSISRVADMYSGQALLVLLDLPFMFLFLGVIYLIAGKLVLVPLALLCVFGIVVVLFGRWMYKQVQQKDINDERRISFLTEVLAGVLSVKTMSVENIMLRRYERLKEASAQQGEGLFFGNAFASGLGGAMSQVMIVLVIFTGAVLVLEGEMTSGALAACMMLSVRSLQPLRKGLGAWMRYQSFIAGDSRVESILSMPVGEKSGLKPLNGVHSSIRLQNITLRYSNDGAEIFKNLSLLVPAGSCIAIKGDSGSGKSSLLALMNGLETVDEGAVLIDEERLSDYDLDSVRKKVALLPQVGTVFVGSIIENLTMFNPDLEPQALELAEKVGLDVIVAGMKQGYQTPLGENSSETLPMGVKQMITIVRALVHDPDVILFDEANNSLDFEGDKKLRVFLEGLKGKKTLILVANRPSLVRLADTVYKIKDGTLELDEDKRQFFNNDQDYDFPDRPAVNDDFEDIIATRVFNTSDLSRSLVPLLHKLGWKGTPRELADALPHLADHVDISYFFSTLANLGFSSHYYGSSFKRFDNRLLPCLYVPDNKPALVVLEELPGSQYRIFDSATNQERVISGIQGKGAIYVFKAIKADDVAPKKQSWVKDLFWKFKSHIMLVFLITIISTVMAVAPSLFVRSVFDSVLPTADVRMGIFLLSGVLIAILLGWFLNTLRSRLLAYIGGRIEYVLGGGIFDRIIRLPASQLNGVSVSRQIGRIRSLERLRDLFLGPLVLLVFDLPASIILLVVLFIINPWAGYVILVSVFCYAVLLYAVRPMSDLASDGASLKNGRRSELIDETLSSMRALRSVGGKNIWLERFRNLSGEAAVSGFKEQQAQGKVGSLAHLIGSMTGVSVLVMSAYMVVHNAITPGTIMATMILTWRLVAPLQNLFMALNSWSTVSTNIRQVNQLMKLTLESDGTTSQANRFVSKGDIVFSRVSFRYAAHLDPALLGISFNATPGQILGITGPDGAGKSTLLSLIDRIYSPQAGSIRIDTIDNRQVSVEHLRSIISYMPQECEIFYGTVSQNLRLVHPAATDEELRWAAEMAGVLEDIEHLDRGFETRISNSRADQLSNGFRQRLSLARTILKPASVVLMDEPGNGMDDAGEEALVRCVNWLRGKVTLIIVTPRPSHLRMADQILYMENGSVTARGTYPQVEDKIMAGLS
ncbi:peptidase domain-containing ABC transporter [Oceanospirillum sediminis]|uniref:ATP-binding cassette domain-containing protein n=1 Tax=Oceanospirillum sediminis TaxID=2760088 RepID=A0A839IXN9_9GAMM|nr:ABC transporter transmembrane domain-containing protein [Oceanospirillum sediminis]MBB1489450.1 ATP-binding cassette domain-containing protein [Oceanospirillum sediminis]